MRIAEIGKGADFVVRARFAFCALRFFALVVADCDRVETDLAEYLG